MPEHFLTKACQLQQGCCRKFIVVFYISLNTVCRKYMVNQVCLEVAPACLLIRLIRENVEFKLFDKKCSKLFCISFTRE